MFYKEIPEDLVVFFEEGERPNTPYTQELKFLYWHLIREYFIVNDITRDKSKIDYIPKRFNTTRRNYTVLAIKITEGAIIRQVTIEDSFLKNLCFPEKEQERNREKMVCIYVFLDKYLSEKKARDGKYWINVLKKIDTDKDPIKEATNETEITENERAEQHWQRMLNEPIINIDFLFFLKSSVGYDWLLDTLDDIFISFFRNKEVKLSDMFKCSIEPDKTKADKLSRRPFCSFWQKYEHEEGYWVQRSENDSLNIVAGFQSTIPWSIFEAQEISTIYDLSKCECVYITLPPKIFSAGLEEAILIISCKSCFFRIYLLDDETLKGSHLMGRKANTFTAFMNNQNFPDFLGFGFTIDHIINKLQNQIMPGYARPDKKQEIVTLLASHGEISFYPTVPNVFAQTAEAEKYRFTNIPDLLFDYDSLERDLKASITDENEYDIENYLKLSELFKIQNRYTESIELLKNITNQIPCNAELFYSLGCSYLHLGRYDEAFRAFKQAESIDPISGTYQQNLAICAIKLNENQTALVHLRKLIAIESCSSVIYDLYGFCLKETGEYEKAISAYETSIELVPTIHTYHCLVSLLCQLKHWEKAESRIAEGLLLKQDDTGLLAHLALSRANNKDTSEALKLLEKVLEIEPENILALSLRPQIKSFLESSNKDDSHA